MNTFYLQNGKLAFRFQDINVCIVSPSRKREHIIAYHPLLELLNIYVHESEVDSYRQYFDQTNLRCGSVNPHTVVGSLAAIRNSMIEDAWAPEIDLLIMTDDDVRGFRFIGARITYEIYKLESILDVVMSTALAARSANAPLFGYHPSGRPQERSAQQPFELRHWVLAHVMGLFDRELRFDPKARTHDDLD